jgi:hypothetical protein
MAGGAGGGECEGNTDLPHSKEERKAENIFSAKDGEEKCLARVIS